MSVDTVYLIYICVYCKENVAYRLPDRARFSHGHNKLMITVCKTCVDHTHTRVSWGDHTKKEVIGALLRDLYSEAMPSELRVLQLLSYYQGDPPTLPVRRFDSEDMAIPNTVMCSLVAGEEKEPSARFL